MVQKSRMPFPTMAMDGLGSSDRRLWEYESYFAMSFSGILPHLGPPSLFSLLSKAYFCLRHCNTLSVA